MKQIFLRSKWHIGVLMLVIIIIAACSSYRYTANIINDSNDEESVEIYFFGIPYNEYEAMNIITYEDFWMKVFNSRGEYPKNKKVFYFGPETSKKQLLDYNDSAWNVWQDAGMKYLCMVAYSPDFTDSSRKDVDWKKIIKLRHYNWWGSSRDSIDVSICNGVLNLDHKD